MKRQFCVVLGTLGLLFAGAAPAGTTCEGLISSLAINTSGSLYVSIGYGTWAVCAVTSTSNGIAPETCRAWYAGLIAAQKAGHGVRFYFSNGTCQTIGNWVVATPNLYHMDLLN